MTNFCSHSILYHWTNLATIFLKLICHKQTKNVVWKLEWLWELKCFVCICVCRKSPNREEDPHVVWIDITCCFHGERISEKVVYFLVQRFWNHSSTRKFLLHMNKMLCCCNFPGTCIYTPASRKGGNTVLTLSVLPSVGNQYFPLHVSQQPCITST